VVDRQTFNLRAGSSILPAPTRLNCSFGMRYRCWRVLRTHLGSHLPSPNDKARPSYPAFLDDVRGSDRRFGHCSGHWLRCATHSG
jgi:hypothetical protein